MGFCQLHRKSVLNVLSPCSTIQDREVANRCFIENSFDFKIRSSCPITNREIITLAVYEVYNKHFL